MTVSVDQIGGIESVLTMVGGKVVYAAAPYQRRSRTSAEPMEPVILAG